MRLHIGASREQLDDPRSQALLDPSWIHLGAPEPLEHQLVPSPIDYRSFFYVMAQPIPFDSESFTFVYSEHFFEHLFHDEACELFKECYRTMRRGACLRIVVPDADLRVYMEPEPAGFSTGDPRWCHPDKHKTRWNIYSLGYALREIGFDARGVIFSDKYGVHHTDPIDRTVPFYDECLDPEVVFRTDYVRRMQESLVVDAIKR